MQVVTRKQLARNGFFAPQKKKLKVLITGITGVVANTLAQHLLMQGHQVLGVSRDPVRAAKQLDPRISLVSWQQLSPGLIATTEVSAIVNFAGAPMIQRWSQGNLERRQALEFATNGDTCRAWLRLNKYQTISRFKLY